MFSMMNPEEDGSSPGSGGVRNNRVTVKTLFDHSGVHKKSTMVINDNDPRIQEVMKAALDRHQDKLKNHEDFLKNTHDKLHERHSHESRASELKKQELQKQREEMKAMLEQ